MSALANNVRAANGCPNGTAGPRRLVTSVSGTFSLVPNGGGLGLRTYCTVFSNRPISESGLRPGRFTG